MNTHKEPLSFQTPKTLLDYQILCLQNLLQYNPLIKTSLKVHLLSKIVQDQILF